MKRLFLATISVVLLLTGCYKDDIWQMHKEIESLRDARLATLAEQAERIEASIDELNGMSASLNTFIDVLENSRKSVEKDITTVRESVSGLPQAFEGEIDASFNEFISRLDVLNDAVLAELATYDSFIATLGKDGDSLQKKIDDLKAYLAGNFALKDWAEGTYGTMKIQKAIIDDIEDIKFHIKALSASSEELHEMLKGLVSDAVAEFRTSFSGELQEEATNITDAYTAALEEMEAALNQEIAGKLAGFVEESEKSVNAWIQEKLDDYLTVSEANAMIAACYSLLGNVPEGVTLQDELDEVRSELSKAMEEVKKAYDDILKEAIEKHEGVINARIEEQILALRDDVIAPVKARIAPLQEAVAGLWKSLADLDIKIKGVEDQKDLIRSSLSILFELETTLGDYVDSIKKEFEKTDSDNYDYLKGLIDALDALLDGEDEASLPSQRAALEAYVGTIPEGKDAASWIETTYATLKAQFSSYATTEKVKSIIDPLNNSLDKQDGEIAGLEERLENLLTSSQESIQKWIDKKLEGYYKTGQIEGLLSGLETAVSSYFSDGDLELQKKIDAISDELTKQKTTLTAAYRKAIADAISTQKGIVDGRIKEEFKPVSSDIDRLQKKAGELSGEVEGLRQELNGYMDDVTSLETTLASIKSFLTIEGYTSLVAYVNTIDSSLSGLSTLFADKQKFETEKAFVNGTLKEELAKVSALVERLNAVKATMTMIDSFLDGFDASEKDLKQQIADIKDAIQSLKTTVDGQTTTVDNLHAQVNYILTMFYGESMDVDNPSEGSIKYMLDNVAAFIVKENLKSISYIPEYLDQKQTVYCDGTTATSVFKFLFKPSWVASLAAGSVDMMFKPYGGELVSFQTQTVTDYDNATGYVEISVSDTSHYSLLLNERGGGSTAVLFYGYEDNGTYVEFTSKFIPLYYKFN